MARDRVRVTNEILPTPARNGLSVSDDFRARVSVFGLGEVFVTVRVMLGGRIGGAARKRQGEDEADRPHPPSSGREDARSETRNAHGRRLACTLRPVRRRNSQSSPLSAALSESLIPSGTYEPASFPFR